MSFGNAAQALSPAFDKRKRAAQGGPSASIPVMDS